ncbi:hypothetical protein Ancab_015803 [Ancistrocladus abbreviatus]
MMRTLVLNPPQLFFPQEDSSQQNPELNFKLKELECISLLKKCKSMEDLKQVHGHILKLGLFWNSFCASNLVATCALSDWGSMDYAYSIFRRIEEPVSFDYNTMIRGYVKDHGFREGLSLFEEMIDKDVEPDNFTYPFVLKACAGLSLHEGGMQIHGQILKIGFDNDVFVQNSLINMYGKCGRIGEACAVFEQMGQRSVASWSALIAAHANLGMWWECLELFRDVNKEGCWRAEETILVSVLSGCTNLGALDFGRSTHGYLMRNKEGQNVIVETSLIDMYIKCGCIEKGLYLFKRMSKKNRLSYSVMISGLAMHGLCYEALSVFSDMLEQGLKPDDVVYLGVLSACRQGLLVEEGVQFLDQLRHEHGIQPTIQHYGCILDLLGRAGMFEKAFELIERMQVEPNDVIWRSLLSAAKLHCNIKMGETAARNLMQQGSDNAADYVMLSNMYAEARRWNDVTMVRMMMASKGLTQVGGFSLVEVKRKLHKFVTLDKSHPNSEEIYEMIHQMEWQLKFEGYSPDTSEVPLDVDEADKRQRLRHHSQKLALAFALVHTSSEAPIRVVRNVRMCTDCHKYTKLISMIYKRKIIVRDRNMFHHFTDGNCSCKDHW